MKRLSRIATLLIVLALGIESIPGAKAITSQDDSIVSVKNNEKIKEFKGIRVDPKPIDLLWQKDTESKPRNLPQAKSIYIENVEQKDFCQTRNDIKTELLQTELFYSMKIQENEISCRRLTNIKHYE